MRDTIFLLLPANALFFPALPAEEKQFRANSSVVERLPYKQVVGGSNPSSPIPLGAVCVEE